MTSIRQITLVLAGFIALTVVDANTIRRAKEEDQAVAWGTAGFPSDSTEETNTTDNFIIGGSDVAPGDLPFYGHFQGVTMCGGALIHEDIFITAAHCLEGGFPPTIKIGAVTTVSENEGQEVNVCAGIIHPNNNMKSMENDIAILKLCDPVFVNSYATIDTNPTEPPTGTDFFIVGFGRTDVSGNLSPFLQTAKVDYLNSDVCSGRYNKYNGEQTMCVDSPSTAICYGDSGGPLLDGSNKVYGLASFIIDTCASSYPDFFTRVSTYSGWVRETVCGQALNPPSYCTGGSSSGGGGTPSQGDGEDEDEDDAEEDPLTTCLNLIIGLIQSITELLG